MLSSWQKKQLPLLSKFLRYIKWKINVSCVSCPVCDAVFGFSFSLFLQHFYPVYTVFSQSWCIFINFQNFFCVILLTFFSCFVVVLIFVWYNTDFFFLGLFEVGFNEAKLVYNDPSSIGGHYSVTFLRRYYIILRHYYIILTLKTFLKTFFSRRRRF